MWTPRIIRRRNTDQPLPQLSHSAGNNAFLIRTLYMHVFSEIYCSREWQLVGHLNQVVEARFLQKSDIPFREVLGMSSHFYRFSEANRRAPSN